MSITAKKLIAKFLEYSDPERDAEMDRLMKSMGGPAKAHTKDEISDVSYKFFTYEGRDKVVKFLETKHRRAEGLGYEWVSKFKPPFKNRDGSVGILSVTPSMFNNKKFQSLVREVGSKETIAYFGGRTKVNDYTRLGLGAN